MTVWSVERMSADAKKRFGQSTGCLRLPRARSTPTSRHWMLTPDVRDNARASTKKGLANLPRAPTPREDTRAAAAAPSLGHTAPGSSMRHSWRCSPAAQPCGIGSFSVRDDITIASDARIEHTEMRRVRQASAARELRGGAAKVNMPAAELSQGALDFRGYAPRLTPREIGGIRRPDPSATAGPMLALNPVLPIDEVSLSPEVSPPVPVASAFCKIVYREPKRLSRQLSVPSEEAMSQLGRLDAQLRDIEQRVEDLHKFAHGQSPPTCESVGQMRTTLAQLEAAANKLETKGVDSIYTSELRSGQVCAKEAKKAQIVRLEKLFVAIEDLFSFLAEAGRNL